MTWEPRRSMDFVGFTHVLGNQRIPSQGHRNCFMSRSTCSMDRIFPRLLFGVKLQHQMFNPPARMEFVRGLKKSAELNRGCIVLASGCTGSGMEFQIVHEVTHFWSKEYDIAIDMPHEYVCESAPPAQTHLLGQFFSDNRCARTDLKPTKPLFFTELTSLAEHGRGRTIPDDTIIPLPSNALGFIGGFSCTSRSPKNKAASSHVNCLQIVLGA